MNSDSDSDNEPLSIVALRNQKVLEFELLPVSKAKNITETKKNQPGKRCNISIELQTPVETTVVERPADVWLYLKDFNTTGPYNCLLCSDWFVNKAKIAIHYVVNHQKDYCGICRYFVPNREDWWAHLKFHIPWRCSLCTENFTSHKDLRSHLSVVHKLIYCRLCQVRLPDDERYDKHLYQNHSVTNISTKYNDVFWDFEPEGNPQFICLLCTKSSIVRRPFADHLMSYHHFTLKCLMLLISGTDLPINIKGIAVTPGFIETQLRGHHSYGYVEIGTPLAIKQEPDLPYKDDTMTVECDPQLKSSNIELDEEDMKMCELVNSYKGDEDFDVTLVELLPIYKCYFDYINDTLNDIKASMMPRSSDIKFDVPKTLDAACCFCVEKFSNLNALIQHMSKMHIVRTLPIFMCRICATVFYSSNELLNHVREELGEFDDLWLCQFCDREFNDRQEVRNHLTEHWKVIQYDNCFSPHLGFKCMYCPVLFWNETDREVHHVRVHFQNHKSNFYKCEICNELFSDKVWFIHHYVEKHKDTNVSYLLKCCNCCVVLEKGEEMRSHFKKNHPEAKKLYCSLPPCTFKPFSQKKSFCMHVKTVHNPAFRSARISTCTICELQFPSARSCSAHVGQAHRAGRFKCNLCDDTLMTSDERKIHYLIRHPGRYQYQCTECDKSFMYKSSLYMHKLNHGPNTKDWTCNFCGKAFMKKDSYREHMYIHETPRHACSYCPMRFVQRSNMLRHERRHTGERPYTCRMCPRTFADKGACTSHLRTHLKDNPYTCVYCGQKFMQKSKLTYHIRKHTGENLETCTICSKKFTSGCSLREHMKTHIRSKMKKTIKCPLCKMMVTDEKRLLRHMQSVHAQTRHQCPLCIQTTSTAASLRDHLLIAHSSIHTYLCQLCTKSFRTKKAVRRHAIVRHGLKVVKATEHYARLDPWQCKLSLDEEAMTNIFGPPKKKLTIEVTVPVLNPEQTVSQSVQEPSIEAPIEIPQIITVDIKSEPFDEDDEPQPTDFVNVKIESMDNSDEEISGI